jgi:hypothetical protein
MWIGAQRLVAIRLRNAICRAKRIVLDEGVVNTTSVCLMIDGCCTKGERFVLRTRVWNQESNVAKLGETYMPLWVFLSLMSTCGTVIAGRDEGRRT